MQTNEIEANLLKLNEKFKPFYIPKLVERKIKGAEKGILSEADLDFYSREYKRLVVELEKAFEKSDLSEKPTMKEDLSDLFIRLKLKIYD